MVSSWNIGRRKVESFNFESGIRKNSAEFQAATQGGDILAQRTQKKIRLSFHPRDRSLGNIEARSDRYLRLPTCLSQLAESKTFELCLRFSLHPLPLFR